MPEMDSWIDLCNEVGATFHLMTVPFHRPSGLMFLFLGEGAGSAPLEL